MTPKQHRFVDEYLVDLNATQAAIRAGYSEKTAEQQGYQLLQKTSVSEAITEGRAKLSEQTGLGAEWVINNLREVAEHCMAEDTYNPMGACRALELIGKHFNAFPDHKDLHIEGETVQRVVSAEPLTEDEWERTYGADTDDVAATH